MRSRADNRILNSLLISMFSMLIPMILATRVLRASSYLSILYMIGYGVLLVSVLMATLGSTVQINKTSMLLLMLYVAVLILPLINDMIRGIHINYYDPINSIVKVVNFFVFCVLMKNVRISKDALYRFMRIVVILSVFVCVYSVVFEFKEILSIRYVVNTNALKIRSVFSNRNQYAAFLIIALTANLYSYQLKKQKSSMYIFALQSFCVLTTFSRAALLSLIIIVLVVVTHAKCTNRKVMMVLVALLVGVGVLFTTEVFDYFVTNYIRWEQSGDSGRFTLWGYAWSIAKSNLLTGVGFYTGVDIAHTMGMSLTQFHNMFFDLLVDGGVLELLFIIGLFYTTYKRCVKRCIDKKLVTVYTASFIAFMLYACFESVSILALSYSDTIYSIFFITLPLLLSNVEKDTCED